MINKNSKEYNLMTYNIKKDKEYQNLLNFIKDMYLRDLNNTRVLWLIGKEMLEVQAKCGWGEHMLHTLADDLQAIIKNIFTFDSLKRMRFFAYKFRDGYINAPTCHSNAETEISIEVNF